MKRNVSLFLLVTAACLGFNSCAGETEQKPKGPVSNESQMSWSTPIPGQGQGQFGMMPQNQYRR